MTSRQQTSPITRLWHSFQAAAGTIVFGMEDGTVSIFGLVFGLAASAPNAHVVLVAGSTGAAAAAVSMMAGTYLDVESANDQTNVKLAELRKNVDDDPSGTDNALKARMVADGFTQTEAERVVAMIDQHPGTKVATLAAVDLGVSQEPARSARVEATWMLVTDLIAASIPVLPFAFLGLAAARIMSLAMTFALLVGLGIGRALIGHRRLLRTVVETITIAAAAAGAGIGIAKLVS